MYKDSDRPSRVQRPRQVDSSNTFALISERFCSINLGWTTPPRKSPTGGLSARPCSWQGSRTLPCALSSPLKNLKLVSLASRDWLLVWRAQRYSARLSTFTACRSRIARLLRRRPFRVGILNRPTGDLRPLAGETSRAAYFVETHQSR